MKRKEFSTYHCVRCSQGFPTTKKFKQNCYVLTKTFFKIYISKRKCAILKIQKKIRPLGTCVLSRRGCSSKKFKIQ